MAAVLQGLLQRGSFPQGAVLQEQTAPMCVPHRPQLLPGPWPHVGCPPTAPSFRHLDLLQHGLLHRCSADMFSSVVLHVRETNYFTMLFSTGCTGISALAPGSSPPPPSLSTLMSAELLLTPFCPHFSFLHSTAHFYGF